MKVVLVGGSGFLGRYVVRALAAHGHHSIVLSRAPTRVKEFRLERNVELVKADVYSVSDLQRRFEGAGAVVSMAGILNERGFGGKGFERVHVELVERIMEACKESCIGRVLHVSALNAGRGASRYLKTKGQAEERLKAEDSLAVTIVQPSVIFGPGDRFFNRFATLLKFSPVLPLACPRSRLQPVYAGDVAAAMAAALSDPATAGTTLELGGPRDYALIDLVRWTARVLGLKRKIVPLPRFLARLQAGVMDFVPGKPFSTDNFLSLQLDNVAPDNALPELGITPRSVESVVPAYLGPSLRQRRLREYRKQARR